MSRDGRFLAVGAGSDQAAGNGVVYPPIARGAGGQGAVYVYERKPSGWAMRQFIKPNDRVDGNFGWSLSFGRNGKDLAVGTPYDGTFAGSVSLY